MENSEINDFIELHHQAWLSNKEISDLLESNLWVELSSEKIRHRIYRMNSSEILSEWAVDTPKYEIAGSNYLFKSRDKTYKIPVKDIDKLFLDYSSYGRDMTGTEIMDKYGISEAQWSAIKSRLGLYKKSHTLSPHTLDNSTPEQEAEAISIAMNESLNSKSKKFQTEYESQFKQRAWKAIESQVSEEDTLKRIQEAVKDHKPIPLAFNKISKQSRNVGDHHYFISDIHLGKMGTDKIIDRFTQILEDMRIMSYDAQTIHITCGGDLVETLAQWGMHEGQIEYGTDPSFGYGFKCYLNAVNVIEKFLIDAGKNGQQIVFRGITGNHDRATQLKALDKTRIMGLTMYEMIKRWLSLHKHITVDYFADRYTRNIHNFEIGNINYILHHGDELDRKNPAELIVNNGRVDMYNVILSGDKHSVQMREGKNYTYIKTPALAGVGEYDQRNMYWSEPGYIFITENEWGTPDITLNRLQ